MTTNQDTNIENESVKIEKNITKFIFRTVWVLKKVFKLTFILKPYCLIRQ